MFKFIKENKKFSIMLAVCVLLLLVAAFGLAVGSALIVGVGLFLCIPAVVSIM